MIPPHRATSQHGSTMSIRRKGQTMPPRTPRRNLLLGTVATLAAARLSVTTNSAALAQASPSAEDLNADWQAVEQALGATGQAMDGEVFRVSMPRSDLAVTVR